VQREAMHPADQFEAFAALVAEGRPIEDIAADFGVTPLVVQRRLKLANVSPRLRADYREGAVTLEQLMALAVSDDHAAQEAAFYESPEWQRSPDALRDHLTCDKVEAGRDALALFVGLPDYEAAGGVVRRDLFADDAQGVFLADPALLERLARDKLAAVAEEVRAEGWAWVEVVPRATSAELHVFQRAPRTRRVPTKAEAKARAALQKKQDALQAAFEDEDGDMSVEQADATQEEIDRIGDALEALEQALVVFSDEVRAMAGAVVSVDHAGGLVVHRGLLQEAQAKALRALERAAPQASGATGEDGSAPTPSGISEKLARRLSAHRTAALQAEVARHPQVALAALVHRLAYAVVLDQYGDGGSPLQLHVAAQFGLAQHAPDLEGAPANTGLQAVRDAWATRLPSDSGELFSALVAMPQEELLKLLAVCVACSVDAVTPRAERLPACALAQAVGLDMHAWWKPTAEGYFDHVAKAKVLEAVQAFAPAERPRLERLKKGELSAEAGRLAAGTDWLPAMLQAAPAPADTVA
jgi:ParB family transcriptional regulator, chromosome partitioning protein